MVGSGTHASRTATPRADGVAVLNWLRLSLICALWFIFLEGVGLIFGAKVENTVAWVLIAWSALVVVAYTVKRVRS